MQTQHKHRAIKAQAETKPWMGCVNPMHPHGERPHGNVIYRDVCACGATRDTEANADTAIRGRWRES